MSRNSLIGSIPGWAGIRKGILERDNYACRICGKDGAEAKLHVHHIDWIREHNDDSNLVTLCHVCHRAVHREGYRPDGTETTPAPWDKWGQTVSWDYDEFVP